MLKEKGACGGCCCLRLSALAGDRCFPYLRPALLLRRHDGTAQVMEDEPPTVESRRTRCLAMKKTPLSSFLLSDFCVALLSAMVLLLQDYGMVRELQQVLCRINVTSLGV